MELNLPKSIEDIIGEVVIDEGWYKVRIVEEPKQMANKKETGTNLVLRCRTVDCPTPEWNGIEQMIWLSLPNPSDEGRFARGNQPLADWKMQRLVETILAFGGSVDGATVRIEAGMEAMMYFRQRPKEDDPSKLENFTSLNDPIRKIG